MQLDLYDLCKRKCVVCGGVNKVTTELLTNKNTFVGYSIKCCHCGHYDEYHLNYKNNGNTSALKPYIDGEQKCAKMALCAVRDCPLFGTSSGESNFPDTTPITPDTNIQADGDYKPNRNGYFDYYERCTKTTPHSKEVVSDSIMDVDYDPSTMIKKSSVIKDIPDIRLHEYVLYCESILNADET